MVLRFGVEEEKLQLVKYSLVTPVTIPVRAPGPKTGGKPEHRPGIKKCGNYLPNSVRAPGPKTRGKPEQRPGLPPDGEE